MTKQMAFYYNQSACTGCKACQIACKDDNDLESGVLWRRIVEVQGGSWNKQGESWTQNLITYELSIACNHCENPLCMEVCPTGAISKRDDGIVLLDQDKCIGCRYCEWTCPYGAVQFQSDKGRMSKCDFCIDNLDQGLPPTCVAACPMRALDFGDLEELRAKYGGVNDIYPMPAPSITNPSIVITPHPKAVKSESAGVTVSNAEEI